MCHSIESYISQPRRLGNISEIKHSELQADEDMHRAASTEKVCFYSYKMRQVEPEQIAADTFKSVTRKLGDQVTECV